MAILRKLILPVILLLLAYAFWQSENIKQITAGVAIFLFGMLALEDGFHRLSGGFLEKFLRMSTDRLWKSLNFGIITTSLMQSSSLVSILTISFLSAGLVDLAGGIGIIFGANIGTTTGAWLLAGFGLKVKLSVYAMPMLVFGIILVFQKSEVLKALGWVLAGIGFLFLGIHNMKEGFDAFRDTIDLSAYAVPGIAGLLIFSLIGIAATVIMQSSHATLVLIITALAASQITYENALALAIGANVGTTITAIIGSLSANIAGKRLAGAHLIFNIITAAIAIIFMGQFLVAVGWISEAVGIAKDNYTLQLAVFHTIFNLVGVLVMVPFIKKLVVFLEDILPETTSGFKKPIYLSDAVLESPQASLESVRKESIRLYDLSLKIIANGLGWKTKELTSKTDLVALVQHDKPVAGHDIDKEYDSRFKRVFAAIVEFVIRARGKFSEEHGENLQVYANAMRELNAAVKGVKHMQNNLLMYIRSDNDYIKTSYNHLRGMIAMVVRNITTSRKNNLKPSEVTLILDHALLLIEENSKKSAKRIEKMIRNRNINAVMATSLIVDTEYTNVVCQNLIAMAKVIFTGKDALSLDIESTIALERKEMAQILKMADEEGKEEVKEEVKKETVTKREGKKKAKKKKLKN